MMTKEIAGQRVIDKLAARAPVNAAFDPTPFIPVALAIIELLKECRASRNAPTPEAAAAQLSADSKNPSFRQVNQVRRHLRRRIDRDIWSEHGQEILQATLKTGAEATPLEYTELLR